MRIQPTTFRPRVNRGRSSRRPIILTFAGLAFTLSDPEARRLADQLVDATEDTGACGKSDDRPDS